MNTSQLKLSLLLTFLLLIGLLIINSCQKDTTNNEKTPVDAENYFVNKDEACIFSEKLFSSHGIQPFKSAKVNS